MCVCISVWRCGHVLQLCASVCVCAFLCGVVGACMQLSVCVRICVALWACAHTQQHTLNCVPHSIACSLTCVLTPNSTHSTAHTQLRAHSQLLNCVLVRLVTVNMSPLVCGLLLVLARLTHLDHNAFVRTLADIVVPLPGKVVKGGASGVLKSVR